ncbi:MAG: hypothetical protein ACFHXK_18165 [bacterium]
MTTRNYLILCVVLSAGLSLSLLYIPSFATFVEQLMLLFLSANAG